MYTIEVLIGDKEKKYKTDDRKLARGVVVACQFLGLKCNVSQEVAAKEVKFKGL